jgi:hypothetical protein
MIISKTPHKTRNEKPPHRAALRELDAEALARVQGAQGVAVGWGVQEDGGR